MARWPRLAQWKRLLQFRLRSLLVLVAFLAVLLGWWSDHRRLNEQNLRKDQLLGVLRTTASPYFDDEYDTWLVEELPALWGVDRARVHFHDATQFLAWVRGGAKWNSKWEAHESDPGQDVLIVLPEAQWPEVIAGLFALRKEETSETPYVAACTLRTLTDVPLSATPALLAAMTEEDRFARDQAIRLLRIVVKKFPPGSRERWELVLTLQRMLDDGDGRHRMAAAKVLSELEPTAATLDDLINAFHREASQDVRRVLAQAIEIVHQKGVE